MRKTINIDFKTKQILDELYIELGYKNRGDFIHDMLLFFQNNSLKPTEKVPTNLKELLSDFKADNDNKFTRIIKILNAYEREYFKQIYFNTSTNLKNEVVKELKEENKKEVKSTESINKSDSNSLFEISKQKKEIEKLNVELIELKSKRDKMILLFRDILSRFEETNSFGSKGVKTTIKTPNELVRFKEEFNRLK